MEKYPHKKFLDDNKEQIEKMPLPRELQKRLIGFDEMQDDLPHTIGEDHKNMEETLEHLSHELLEDLEEHYGHHLENNELHGEETEHSVGQTEHRFEQTQPEAVKENDAPEQVVQEEEPQFRVELDHQPGETHEEEVHEEQPQETNEEEPKKEDVVTEETHESQEEVKEELKQEDKEPTDEEILSELHSKEKLKVHPTELKAKGFKGHLQSKVIGVGKFCLRRGKYETCYTIYLNN